MSAIAYPTSITERGGQGFCKLVEELVCKIVPVLHTFVMKFPLGRQVKHAKKAKHKDKALTRLCLVSLHNNYSESELE